MNWDFILMLLFDSVKILRSRDMRQFVRKNGRYAIFIVVMVFRSCCIYGQLSDYMTPFEQDNNYSASSTEALAWYQSIAEDYPGLRIRTVGTSDAGLPIHEVVISIPGGITSSAAHASGKCVLMINNAIHPGEPCGVDATMLWVRHLIRTERGRRQLENMVVVIIPYYNVDGGRIRSPFYRANQNGPTMQGFRGTARNYDLNRDFMKCDTRNTETFYRVFQEWMPDVFIDTHTSNGADYQHTMTLLASRPEHLATGLREFQQQTMLPFLYDSMAAAGWPMSPYVYSDGPPETGIRGFWDSPRYSTGYTAMYQTLGFMTEAHMLKPFADRVHATATFLEVMSSFIEDNHKSIIAYRKSALAQSLAGLQWPVYWKVDSTKMDMIPFMGYTALEKPSEVTGAMRLYYDRSLPWSRHIPYFNHFLPEKTITTPTAYVVPAAWHKVQEKLRRQNVKFQVVQMDTIISAGVYTIHSVRHGSRAYEGRFPHQAVVLEENIRPVHLWEGDWIVPVDQVAGRFVIHALEPEMPDSWFVWNEFDAILQQKEYFSDYVFEDLAAEMLRKDAGLRAAFEAAKDADTELSVNAGRQLDWLYRNSPYYEPTHRVYPVYRLMGK